GSKSLTNEVEFCLLYGTVFNDLHIEGYRIHINNRKILRGLMEVNGVSEYEKFILITIDKLDKVGLEEIEKLLSEKIRPDQFKPLLAAYSISGSRTGQIEKLKTLLQTSSIGREGILETETILSALEHADPVISKRVVLDLTLARGLDYYTGTIFEIKAPETVKIGSIGGGGRYDDLTGLFGLPDMPGVGISFGVDRIYDVMEELQLFPEGVAAGSRALFFNLGEEMPVVFAIMHELRKSGISCELYHEPVKFDRQFKYAERKNIPFAVIIGKKEITENSAVVKNLITGKQEVVSLESLRKSLFI
ncbi:MAG TPA: ATP phosphoribosyltransferase regulatory subunit, partial [Flavitalea sp.]|nr:ATP phosphoribosyltransferase regulatory subunit [Flavitalea sp.]